VCADVLTTSEPIAEYPSSLNEVEAARQVFTGFTGARI
jgi:hypothetical protein